VERSQTAREVSALTKTFVALLRGVNVGAARRLTSAALQAAFVEAGGCKVETLLQSGNVVFEAPAKAGREIAARARASGMSPKIPLTPSAPKRSLKSLVDDDAPQMVSKASQRALAPVFGPYW